MVSILDCTLRDGGYVNSFAFGEREAQEILTGIEESGIEYIEIGFLRNTRKPSETTIYSSVDQVSRLVHTRHEQCKYFAMIVFGTFDINKLPKQSLCILDGIRVTFKKDEIDEALEYIRHIREKGYIVSVNPTGIHMYSDREFLELLQKVNDIEPDIFALVDTLGLLKRAELLRLLYLVENNMNAEISLAFHAHNNMQMAFAHAQTLIEAGIKRELIIDVSLRGMGRGAGNLCTELLLQYLNESFDCHFNLIPILKSIDEQINKIYAATPWGYNLPYYLAASLSCHPNYATFLMDKGTISIPDMGEVLAAIPRERKSIYDKELIQKLYLSYQENKIDDEQTLRELRQEIDAREVLLLGPGKTMQQEREKIHAYVGEHVPYIVSINYRPYNIKVNKVFISNSRRYAEQTNYSDVVVTSNIKTTHLPQLNYGSYLNESALPDNALLMLLKVLIRIGVKQVSLAGLDGFGKLGDNYYRSDMSNYSVVYEMERCNEEMATQLKKLSKQIGIRFITTSLYQK